jgi:hypothetical protein
MTTSTDAFGVTGTRMREESLHQLGAGVPAGVELRDEGADVPRHGRFRRRDPS